ncbi:hypothetical protein [Porphyromonas pogonae]
MTHNTIPQTLFILKASNYHNTPATRFHKKSFFTLVLIVGFTTTIGLIIYYWGYEGVADSFPKLIADEKRSPYRLPQSIRADTKN